MDSVNFHNASFQLPADFENAVFARQAYFSQANFQNKTSFQGTEFRKRAKFSAAHFAGAANFQDVRFTEQAEFSSAKFVSEADFEHACFNGRADFKATAFLSRAEFGHVIFEEMADFTGAAFTSSVGISRSKFDGPADFSNATFGTETSFNGSTFGDEARFSGTTFHGEANFRSSHFLQYVSFADSKFSGLAWFNMARFNRRLDFARVTFEMPVFFESISWPDIATDWHRAFLQTRFRDTCSFSGSGFRSFAAFDGARFGGDLRVDDVGESVAGRAYAKERKAVIQCAKTDRTPSLATLEQESENEARDRLIGELERGCRVLKHAMSQASDRSREQLLYKFELLSRRSKTSVGCFEKLASDIYGWVSDYGASIERPLVWLLLTFILCAVGYFAWALGSGIVGTDSSHVDFVVAQWQAAEFSLSNVFKPFSSLAESSTTPKSLADLLLSHKKPGLSFAVRLVATLQSFISIVLLFLSGIALRRRFQIS